MLFQSPLVGVLFIGIANALRSCDDCMKLEQCPEVSKRLRAVNKNDVTTKNMLKRAKCGYRKVCCSDFAIRDEINKEEYDIQNHPNINLLPEECGSIEGSRIIGGKRANMNEFPWLALISYINEGERKFGCGGTVINKRYVLTAAHCIKGKHIDGVRIGEYDISSKKDCVGFRTFRACQNNLQDVMVSKEIMHPNYTRVPITLNDIGLLRLKKPLDLTVANAGTTCLPTLRFLQDLDIAGKTGTVAGWGITENKTTSNVLLKVAVPIHDKNTCMSFYDRKITSNSSIDRFGSAFCAGGLHRDSCDGDSGGALMLEALHKNDMYKMVQFGIVSYGPIHCGSATPGVYTEVKKYMKWILDNIRP